VTVVGACALAGMVEALPIEGSPAGPVFATCIEAVFVPVLRPGQTVIMDNRSSHKVDGIQEAMAAVGASLEY
jgi:hypothetical protein